MVAHTPVLGEPLEGQVFLGTPNCGPCTLADAQNGSMVRLFLQLRAPSSGIVLKIPGTTSVDPSTGALTASFPESPQQPFGDLTLTLKGGPRAPLATPQSCGTFTTNSTLDAVVCAGVGSAGAVPQLVCDRLRLQSGVRAVVLGGHDEQPGGCVQPAES